MNTGEQQDCFAYDEARAKRGGCKALTEWGGRYGTRCVGCPFFKTTEQYNEGLRKHPIRERTEDGTWV